MIKNLRAHRLVEGYRGSKPVNREELTSILPAFCDMVMDIHEFIESVALISVLCSPEQCMAADARIILVKR